MSPSMDGCTTKKWIVGLNRKFIYLLFFNKDTLRHHKVEVSKYEAKVRSFYKELEEVLEEDQDLNMMHLTKIQHDGEVEEDMEHDEVSGKRNTL